MTLLTLTNGQKGEKGEGGKINFSLSVLTFSLSSFSSHLKSLLNKMLRTINTGKLINPPCCLDDTCIYLIIR